MNEEEIRKTFNLPESENKIRSNVQSYSIQDCHKDYNCLNLIGFDHMGAGDVECGFPGSSQTPVQRNWHVSEINNFSHSPR